MAEFVTAYNNRLKKFHVGIVTDDKRCRIDLGAGERFEDITLWDTIWDDPNNPWRGGRIQPIQRTDLTMCYS